MTDRVNTLTVILEDPIRDDDVEGLMDAIRSHRGVLDVKLGDVGETFGARMQQDAKWVRALVGLVDNGPGEEG